MLIGAFARDESLSRFWRCPTKWVWAVGGQLKDLPGRNSQGTGRRGARRLRLDAKADVLVTFTAVGYRPSMTDPVDKLTPADPRDLTDALAFALRYQGRKRVHSADEIMAEIVAKRLVEHLERAGFVVMKRPADIGGAALGRGFEG